MEKKQNPNSHKRLRRRRRGTSNTWSELPLDLLISVFKRLSFANFQRAKSVCSSWYSASKQSVPKNTNPWLILFPKVNKDNNSCTLFNPEEEDKLYKTRDLGSEFAKSVCQATYGSWLLVRDPVYNLYITNLLTSERIDLPSMDSQLGLVKVESGSPYTWPGRGFYIFNDVLQFSIYINMKSPVFWVDEKTKDFIVIFGLSHYCVVYAKKGDTSWNQIPEASDCHDMIYKDHKVYFLSRLGSFIIFDFAGEISQQTFQCGVKMERFELGRRPSVPIFTPYSGSVVSSLLVVTLTGKVIEVQKTYKVSSGTWYFHILDIYSKGFIKKPQLIESLGDESILLDQGITVLASDTDGIMKNSIYFSGSRDRNVNEIFVFNLKTHKTESLHKFDCPYIHHLYRPRWFFPDFTHTL